MSIAGGGSGGVSGLDGATDDPVQMISGASGGFLVSYPVNLTPGESISINIGIGGLAGPYPNGGVGGTTSFGGYLSCTGSLQYAPPPYESDMFPGACGAQGGVGNTGQYIVIPGGVVSGGKTPLGYGNGGDVGRCNGCVAPNPTMGKNGAPGVVIVDVLY